MKKTINKIKAEIVEISRYNPLNFAFNIKYIKDGKNEELLYTLTIQDMLYIFEKLIAIESTRNIFWRTVKIKMDENTVLLINKKLALYLLDDMLSLEEYEVLLSNNKANYMEGEENEEYAVFYTGNKLCFEAIDFNEVEVTKNCIKYSLDDANEIGDTLNIFESIVSIDTNTDTEYSSFKLETYTDSDGKKCKNNIHFTYNKGMLNIILEEVDDASYTTLGIYTVSKFKEFVEKMKTCQDEE